MRLIECCYVDLQRATKFCYILNCFNFYYYRGRRDASATEISKLRRPEKKFSIQAHFVFCFCILFLTRNEFGVYNVKLVFAVFSRKKRWILQEIKSLLTEDVGFTMIQDFSYYDFRQLYPVQASQANFFIRFFRDITQFYV